MNLATAFKFDKAKEYKCLECSDTGSVLKVRYVGKEITEFNGGTLRKGDIWDKAKLDNAFYLNCLRKFVALHKSGLIVLDKAGNEILSQNPWLKNDEGNIRDPLGYVSVGLIMHKHFPDYRERNNIEGEHYTPCPKRCYDRLGVIRK